MQLKDSIFGIEKNESIQELNTKYETEISAVKKLFKLKINVYSSTSYSQPQPPKNA